MHLCIISVISNPPGFRSKSTDESSFVRSKKYETRVCCCTWFRLLFRRIHDRTEVRTRNSTPLEKTCFFLWKLRTALNHPSISVRANQRWDGDAATRRTPMQLHGRIRGVTYPASTSLCSILDQKHRMWRMCFTRFQYVPFFG